MPGSRIVNSFLWSFLEQGGVKLAQLIVQIILARILVPEMFGVLAILLVVVGVADMIAQSGLGTALVQEDDVNDTSFSTALWLSMGLSALLYAIMYFAAPFIAEFYGMDDLVIYLRVMLLVVFINGANSVQRSYLQKYMNFKLLSISSIVATVGSGIVGIACAIAGLGIWALIIQVLAQSVFAFIVLLIVVPWKPSFSFNAKQAKSLYSYGWKMCVTSVLNTLYSNISELIIGKTCSTGDLGYYSQGRKWPIAAIGAGSNALSNVLFPAFVELKHDMPAFRNAAKRAVIDGTFVIAPLALGMAAVGEPLIAVLMTDKWLPCVPVFQFTCISYSVLMLELVSFRAYMALGESGLYLKLHLIRIFLGFFVVGGAAILFRDIYVIAGVTSVYVVFTILIIDLQPAKRMYDFGRVKQLRCIMPVLGCSFVAATCAYGVTLFPLGYGIKLFLGLFVLVAVYILIAKMFRLQGYTDCKSILKSLADRKT